MTTDELDRECWNSSDDGEMCWRIRSSGLHLSDDDARLVSRLFDECGQRASVYDLYRLNMLCHQAIGWRKAKQYSNDHEQ